MTRLTADPSAPADLTACDREPVHTPGAVQAHGAVVALTADGCVGQASANLGRLLGVAADRAVGRPLAAVVGPGPAAALLADFGLPSLDLGPMYLRTVAAGGRPFRAVGHRYDGVRILEFEPAGDGDPPGFQHLYPVVRGFLAGLDRAASVPGVCRLAAEEARRLTGFDRVLVYRFDDGWNGHVLAEDRDDRFPSYLGLHFPASDIPAQVRELYRVSRLRVIPDARADPAPLVPDVHPDTGRPLDLTFAALRGLSPVHREYLANMGIAASASAAVLSDGRLWGLISCHHHSPRPLPFEVRTALDLLAQLLAAQVAAHDQAADIRHRIELKALQARLLAAMAADGDFVSGLTARPDDLLAFMAAGGAAVVYDGRCVRVGDAPPEPAVRRLVDRIADAGPDDVFYTDAVGDHFPDAADLVGRAAGVLAVGISKLHRSYVLWFRPEVVRTVAWGGDPTKAADPGTGRVHPRKSFEAWKQVVRGRSRPWRPAEPAAAADLRNDIVGIVLRKAEERAALAAELERSNKELEAFSYSVSHDLRAPFRHIVGYAELLKDRAADKLDATDRRYLDTITDSARFAGSLVDNLLSFSQMGRSALHPVAVDLGALALEVRRQLMGGARGRQVEWVIGRLPVVRGDLVMLRLVFQNLLENALKFTAHRPVARVEVGADRTDGEVIVWVADNGAGFDMRYADKLFGVFQRLHKPEEFEGTGIGLANVRRIVSRHGGRTWADGRVGQGATFFFTLPATEGAPEGGAP